MTNVAPTSASPAAASTLRVVLGVTGGIAAYKSAELVRLFKKAGVDVHVVLTDAGAKFITPVTMQALSGNPVFMDSWDARVDNNMAHIELTRGAAAILIAPATADFMAKLAHGHANDLLSTLCLARPATCPLLIAPAMNREMWENPATVRNVAQLAQDGVHPLGPAAGDQACGEVGFGRMLEPEAILAAVLGKLAHTSKSDTQEKNAFFGKNILMTAGPTFEPIDPVRGITNRSSGKMGYAIAAALTHVGAHVTLISGPTALAAPAGVTMAYVETSLQMFDAVKENLAEIDVFFAVAAVADYTPATVSGQKIKKSTETMSVDLVPTQDILAWVAAQIPRPYCIGFAAESENVVEYARKKRLKKAIDVIIANHANSAIGADDNQVTIIDGAREIELPRLPKTELAAAIVNAVAHSYAVKSIKNQ